MVIFGCLTRNGTAVAYVIGLYITAAYTASTPFANPAVTLARAHNELESALRDFFGFWLGASAWSNMLPTQRAAVVKAADRIALDWQASFAADADPRRLAILGTRTLLICGDRSPEPMLRLVEALHVTMAGSKRIPIRGAGHLLPVTHASEMTQTMLSHFHADAERRLR